MPPNVLLVVTGASGTGKTTMVRALASEGVPGCRCHHFDSLGVPSSDQMTTTFGSPEHWQEAMTHEWITRLATDPEEGAIAILDGQVLPSVVADAFARNHVPHGRLLLLDCATEVRERRLREDRGQPELATSEMASWAACLRGQADALRIPILDTTVLTVEAAVAHLRQHVAGLVADAV